MRAPRGSPLLVSIGYSACHWCHVMERESFEDPKIAELMNEHFISIKVDREERPDVDQIYMDTLMRLQGHGGWPLTVFCKSNGEPYYAGTYFPPEPRQGLPSFQEILLGMARALERAAGPSRCQCGADPRSPGRAADRRSLRTRRGSVAGDRREPTSRQRRHRTRGLRRGAKIPDTGQPRATPCGRALSSG